MNDIKARFVLFEANAAKYQLKYLLFRHFGSSSGGNMASMAGKHRRNFYKKRKHWALGNLPSILKEMLDQTPHKVVRLMLLWIGFWTPTNMLVMDSCGGTNFVHNDGTGFELMPFYIGGPIQENKDANVCLWKTVRLLMLIRAILLFDFSWW